jgi:hypothetical protein
MVVVEDVVVDRAVVLVVDTTVELAAVVLLAAPVEVESWRATNTPPTNPVTSTTATATRLRRRPLPPSSINGSSVTRSPWSPTN